MGILDEILGGAIGGQGLGRAGPAGGRATGGNSALVALLPIVLAMLANRRQGPVGPSGGGLGDVLGQMLGTGGAQRGGGGLGDVLGQVLGGGAAAGGLGGLLQKLEQGGLGAESRSWVSTGQNLAPSPDAIGRILGADGISAIARHAGLSEGDATAGLARLLPEVIDHVSPQGRIPDDDQLESTLKDLMRRLG
jgi:uncharacterized protein YidB (DUF937 family)